jgi:hypothetical protein
VYILPSSKAARLLPQLPQNCRTFSKIKPASQWQVSDLLLNKATYFLEVLAWQQSKDASAKPPKNIPVFTPLPGYEEEKPKNNPDEMAMEVDDIKAFLSRPRENVKVKSNE